MSRVISDLPNFTGTVADGDFLVCHNVSNSSNNDEKLTISKLLTDTILARANTFTANQRVDALVGVNAVPSTDAQVLVVSGAAGRGALRAKAATSPTVAALDVVNSSDVTRHELWAEYGTNIPAARTMATYREFYVQPAVIAGTIPGPAQTLTVNVVGVAFAHQPVFMEVVGTFRNNGDGDPTRAEWVDDVLWRTRANATTNATIDANTRRISDINLVTVTGPTAINGGVRYTVQSTSSSLVRSGLFLRVFSSNPVTVTASVA